MLGRLILVVLGFFVVSTVVRIVRAAFRRSPPDAARPPRPDLDPSKRISANWSEVASDREGGTTD